MPADNDTLSAVGDLCGPVVLNQIGAPGVTALVDARGQIHRVMLHPLLPDTYPACSRHAAEVLATG